MLFLLHWRYELPCQDELPEFHCMPILGCIRFLWLVFHPLGLRLDKTLCGWNSVKYHEAVGEGIWPPATSTKDSKVAPSGYCTAAQLNTLVQEFGSGKGHGGTSPHDKSQDVCQYCGETGHWAKDCPKKACNLAAGHLSSGGHGGRGSGGGNSRCKDDHRGHGCGHHTGRGGGRNGCSGPRRELAPWKLEGPTPGQPKTLQKDGLTFYWCAKCMPPEWTTMHSTANHGTHGHSPQAHALATDSPALSFDASAWMVDVNCKSVGPDDA